ncbi:MAG: SDR family NAD(P)-dependent oxidoreductase [Nitrospinae bacterium]|nr:SDR family NAD(P)-dependent oxidoreductase [Nitrospinota bacterium]
MRDLAGRTAVLTGASRGIGPYIARALVKERMNLVLAARSAAELEGMAAEACASDVRAIAVPTDVADRTALEALVARATHEFGTVDVLVNNAGIVRLLAYHKLRAEDIERIIRVNLTAPMLLTWMVLPGMLERRCGHIVNMSSLAGKAGPPYNEPYAAVKAGLIGFTESLRAEYRGTGISASVICPGFVKKVGIYQQLSERTGLVAPWLLGMASPEAVARAVVHAIKRDAPEVLVNPGPTRLLMTLAELSPSLSEWVMRCSGMVDLFRKVAEFSEREAVRPDEDA